MKIRPGRERSLFGGIAILVVMIVGLVMMSSFGSMAGGVPGAIGGTPGPAGGVPGAFVLLWVLLGLAGAGTSFYNAFSSRGLPLYEVEMTQDARFCPHCGKPIGKADKFCRYCGASFDDMPNT